MGKEPHMPQHLVTSAQGQRGNSLSPVRKASFYIQLAREIIAFKGPIGIFHVSKPVRTTYQECSCFYPVWSARGQIKGSADGEGPIASD